MPAHVSRNIFPNVLKKGNLTAIPLILIPEYDNSNAILIDRLTHRVIQWLSSGRKKTQEGRKRGNADSILCNVQVIHGCRFDNRQHVGKYPSALNMFYQFEDPCSEKA